MPIDPDMLGLDDGDGIARLLRRYYPLLLAAAYADAGQAIDAGLAFDLENPRIQQLLDRLALQVRGVTDTTRQQIRTLVGVQAEEGWSAEQLARFIRTLGDDWSRSRALLIARTETATAYSLGALAAYAESGVVDATEWLTAPSDACEICAPFSGQRAALGEAFAGGISHPPAHPGCRCSLVPILSEA
jgi:SPP1 gp7 family putative phage head morphogenesis protein